MKRLILVLLFTMLTTLPAPAQTDLPQPPPPPREFRAAWVASVSNIDWPSRPDLTTDQQKAELLAILDRAVQLNLNAIILHIRPSCDALYASPYEPWSPYLTGTMGKAPEPFYDPLAFAVEEAHKRGLELHAWFNPYRVRHASETSEASPNHISKAHPEWVRQYGKYLWLDPAEPGAQEHSLRVIEDVVRRYDVDGVHIDDYFYPYRENGPDGKPIEFPDDAEWTKYQQSGGKLTRSDWRRSHIDYFVEEMYKRVKKIRTSCKVGISPFGIWRPGNPPQIKGLDAYEELYADSKRWVNEGWLDYNTPQLYWRIDAPAQSFPVLLAWWSEQNTKKRHLWAGQFTSRYDAREIAAQIEVTRTQAPNEGGNVHFSMKTLMKNPGAADSPGTTLLQGVYSQPALIPPSPWLDTKTPESPKAFTVTTRPGSGLTVQNLVIEKGEPPFLWLLQARETSGVWHTFLLPGTQTETTLSEFAPVDTLAVTAVRRGGNLGKPRVQKVNP